MPPIRVAEQFTTSINEAPIAFEFGEKGLTGAEVFARICKREGLGAMFCCPGNYTVINAMAAAGVPAYGGRTEGAMCAAADGFSRVTGEVTASSGTEGPGFTHMIMNIAAAHAARTPLLVLASNMQIAGDDREAFIQTGYQQPTTTGMKKYGKRLIAPERVWEYGGYAFRNMKTGVPGPVHLDFPGEVARARFTDPAKLKDYYTKDKYRTESRAYPSPSDVKKAVDLIARSERPLIVAGQGVFHRKCWDLLMQAAEKNNIAVAATGPMKGHFPDDHRLSINLSPDALMSADLVLFIGQYCMPSPGEYAFNPDIKAIRVHPVPEDLGRNWPLDLGIVSDEKAALEALADALPKRQRAAWVAELAAARKKFGEVNDEYYALGLKDHQQTGVVHPAVISKVLADFLYAGDIPKEQTTFAQGGIDRCVVDPTMAARVSARTDEQLPNQDYPIGPDVGHLLGAGAAMQLGVGPQKAYQGAPVFGFTGDAGIAYSVMESTP